MFNGERSTQGRREQVLKDAIAYLWALKSTGQELSNGIWHAYIEQHRRVIYRWKALDLYFSTKLLQIAYLQCTSSRRACYRLNYWFNWHQNSYKSNIQLILISKIKLQHLYIWYTTLISSKITKIFQCNMMTMVTFCDTWRYLVTFDDIWLFFVTKPCHWSWYVMTCHEVSWNDTNLFRDVGQVSGYTLVVKVTTL